MKCNTDSFSFYSVCISYFRDSKFTSAFCIPVKCVADNHIEQSQAHCHISFVTESHSCDRLAPNMFMHATAVELSINTFMWIFVRPFFAKAFKPNKIAFSSSTLISYFILDVENKLLLNWTPLLHPNHKVMHQFWYTYQGWEQCHYIDGSHFPSTM